MSSTLKLQIRVLEESSTIATFQAQLPQFFVYLPSFLVTLINVSLYWQASMGLGTKCSTAWLEYKPYSCENHLL
jgi:hypothetical protein